MKLLGSGTGGPNTEFLMGLALELNGAPVFTPWRAIQTGLMGPVTMLAPWLPRTHFGAAAAELDPGKMLDNNDAYGFFAGLGIW